MLIHYKFDNKIWSDLPYYPQWLNKLFMPAKYARYFIEITAVRCERLQDICDEDCLKEGIKETDCICENVCNVYENGLNMTNRQNETLIIQYDTPREAHAVMIDKINRKGTWESNPYVWVYDYELVPKSFDQILDENVDILKQLKDNG